ncbi:CIC11C00000002528 [Sungouiella intermedia]|uniref:CIC11C00000002528 n=1 Tax=Sungouiella intermedia TaxID=45354 RepID=A0A1L0BKU4_9ASCO|nr:CIC11C00000002528 [[Candida] intermedia]
MNIDFNLLDDIDKSDTLEPEQSQSAMDRLLVLQTRKVELIQQRDALLARKQELADSIDRLNITLDDYQQQHHQYETRKKLEYYLHQNDHEYAKLAASDGAASFVIDNLNVLPSSDWPLRLHLVKEFYPHMTISDCDSYTEYDSDKLLTVKVYSVAAKGLPTLQVKLFVLKEAVYRIEVVNWEKVAFSLQKISPTFHKTVKRNYIPRKKIDLIMYSYHSLAQLEQKRVAALSEILSTYSDLVLRPAHDWINDPFSTLVTLPYVELDLSLKGPRFTVRLYWTLCLNNSITGSLESELEIAIIGEETTVVANANEVFLRLIPQHGVVGAFKVMLVNIFGLG